MGHGLFESLLLLPHKIRAKQKEQHPIRCCSWCDREDSNLWPSGSENYDAARNSMIHCDFLLVPHSSVTPVEADIKQCANDKNRPPAANITAGGQLVVNLQSIFLQRCGIACNRMACGTVLFQMNNIRFCLKYTGKGIVQMMLHSLQILRGFREKGNNHPCVHHTVPQIKIAGVRGLF